MWEIEKERHSVSEAIKSLKQCKRSFLYEAITPDSEGWDKKSIEEAFMLLPSNSLSRNNLNNDAGDVIDIHYGDIHVVFDDIVDVKNSYLTYVNPDAKMPKVKPEAYGRNGDIVIADASEDTDELGKTIELINITDEKVLAGLHTFFCRPKISDFEEGFLGYAMNSDYVHDQIEKFAVGTKVYSITKKDLLQVIVPVPPAEIQINIVDKLRKMDKALSVLKAHELESRELFKSVLRREL